MNAEQILNELTEAYAQRDLLKIQHSETRDAAIPEEVEAALADIDIEFSKKFDSVDQKITLLESAAKKAVLEAGETVKGGALQAVYVKGRVSWDAKKLDGMMMIIPEIGKARKEGEPSVTIRKVG